MSIEDKIITMNKHAGLAAALTVGKQFFKPIVKAIGKRTMAALPEASRPAARTMYNTAAKGITAVKPYAKMALPATFVAGTVKSGLSPTSINTSTAPLTRAY